MCLKCRISYSCFSFPLIALLYTWVSNSFAQMEEEPLNIIAQIRNTYNVGKIEEKTDCLP